MLASAGMTNKGVFRQTQYPYVSTVLELRLFAVYIKIKATHEESLLFLLSALNLP